MRIITVLQGQFLNGKLKILWTDEKEYNGALAYAKGKTTNEVVPTGPWEGQVPYLQQLFSGAQNLFNNNPLQYPTGPTVATSPTLAQNQTDIMGAVAQNQPIIQQATNTAMNAAPIGMQAAAPLVNPLQAGILSLIRGQNPALGAGQAMLPQAQQAITGAVNSAGGGINTAGAPQNPVGNMDITGELQTSLQGGSLNPFLDQIVQGATRNLNRQFETQTIPGIRDASMAAGQRGGSSEGIARGLAAENLQDNVADVVSQIFGSAYESGAQERQNAMGIISGANAQNPQLQLGAAQINNQSTGLGLNAADMILQQLMGGTNAAIQGVGTGTAQAGELLGQGTQQLFQGLGLIPGLQNAGLQQQAMGNQVGLQQLGQEQAQIDSEIARFFFEQFAPYMQLAQFQNFIMGNYGSSLNNQGNGANAPTVPTYIGM